VNEATARDVAVQYAERALREALKAPLAGKVLAEARQRMAAIADGGQVFNPRRGEQDLEGDFKVPAFTSGGLSLGWTNENLIRVRDASGTPHPFTTMDLTDPVFELNTVVGPRTVRLRDREGRLEALARRGYRPRMPQLVTRHGRLYLHLPLARPTFRRLRPAEKDPGQFDPADASLEDLMGAPGRWAGERGDGHAGDGEPALSRTVLALGEDAGLKTLGTLGLRLYEEEFFPLEAEGDGDGGGGEGSQAKGPTIRRRVKPGSVVDVAQYFVDDDTAFDAVFAPGWKHPPDADERPDEQKIRAYCPECHAERVLPAAALVERDPTRAPLHPDEQLEPGYACEKEGCGAHLRPKWRWFRPRVVQRTESSRQGLQAWGRTCPACQTPLRRASGRFPDATGTRRWHHYKVCPGCGATVPLPRVAGGAAGRPGGRGPTNRSSAKGKHRANFKRKRRLQRELGRLHDEPALWKKEIPPALVRARLAEAGVARGARRRFLQLREQLYRVEERDAHLARAQVNHVAHQIYAIAAHWQARVAAENDRRAENARRAGNAGKGRPRVHFRVQFEHLAWTRHSRRGDQANYWLAHSQRHWFFGQVLAKVKGLCANHALEPAPAAAGTDAPVPPAERRPIPVYEVSARHTSQTCSRCGHRSKTARAGKTYRCRADGAHRLDADLNAARNVATRFPRKWRFTVEAT
jgi:hypothetical protein